VQSDTRPGGGLAALAAVALAACAVAGACGSGGGNDLPAVDGPVSPGVDIHASEMMYTPDAIAVEAGSVEVVLHNDGTVRHDLSIGQEPFIIEAAPGQTATGTVALEEGSYELYCSLPGHRDGGMIGVLEVR
jgi:uncharacterized cupredoxin-like copper-binding protein